MAEKAKTIKLGAPLDRDTKMGPLVSREQYDRVRSYQEIGKKEAKLASGGGRAEKFAEGYYVEPTIFYDVDNSARIAREEIFGPVAAVIPFEDEEDATQDCQRFTLWPCRCRLDARHLSKPFAWSSRCARVSSGSTICSRPMSKHHGEATSNPGSAVNSVLGNRGISRDQASAHQLE